MRPVICWKSERIFSLQCDDGFTDGAARFDLQVGVCHFFKREGGRDVRLERAGFEHVGYNDLRRKSVEELKQLKSAGLDMAYVDLESGDPVTLEKVKKGMTPEEAIEGAANAKAAGIRVLASFIFGMGGRDRSKEHIEKTVELLNIIQPEEMAPMALAIQPGTELEQEMERGEFVMPTTRQVLVEEKYLLENMGDFDCFYWGDHGNNIVSLKGRLPAAHGLFLQKIEGAIANHPVTKEDALETFAW